MRHLIPVILLAALPVWAQQDNRQPLPAVPPPPPGMEAFDAALEPQVTIRKEGENTISEYRIKGRLYMMKVTPAHGRPYVLVDHKGDGQFARQDNLDSGLRVPQWVLLEF